MGAHRAPRRAAWVSATRAWNYRVHPQSLSWDRKRMLSRQLDTFASLEAQLALPPRSQQLLRDLADFVRAAYSFDLAKELIAEQRYHDAVIELARAKSFRRDLRVEAALLGVSHFPRLTRALYLVKKGWRAAFRWRRPATIDEPERQAPEAGSLPSQAIDRAGKAYWDAIWSTPSGLLKPVDPRARSIWSYRERQFHRLFADLFARRNGQAMTLMEIGCARSVWLPVLLRANSASRSTVSITPSGARARPGKCCRGTASMATSRAQTYLRRRQAGFGKFDVVVSFGVMEHFQDTARALHGASAYLKPGGLLITEIPNLVGINGWIQRLVNRPVFDIHVPMGTSALARHHRAAGLDVVKCEYVVAPDFGVLNLAGLPQNLAWHIKDRLLFGLRLLTGGLWWLEQKVGPMRPGRFAAGFLICTARKPMVAAGVGHEARSVSSIGLSA